MPGIDQVINDRMNAFAGQPEALAQRYAQNQDLLDLLALQKMKTDKAAAMREVQASMQANPTTVRDQLNQEAMTQTRQEMAAQAMQGAQGMQLNQRRAMQARGIPTLPAPNMARRRGYQQGGIIPAEPKPKPTMGAVPPSAVGNEQIKQFAKEYMGIKKALEDPQQAEFKERNQMLLQDLIRQMGDQMPAVMQYIDSMKGIVEPRGFAGPEGSYVSGATSNLVDDALSYLAERGMDAAQYTTDQLAALGRQLQESGIAPTFKGVQQIQSAVEQGADFVRDRRNQRNLPSVADEQGDVLSQVLSGAAQATGDRMPNIVEGMAEIGRNMPSTDLGQSPRLRLPTIGLPNIVEGIAALLRPSGATAEANRIERAQQKALGKQAEEAGSDVLDKVNRGINTAGATVGNPENWVDTLEGLLGLEDGALFSGVPSVEELYPTSTKVIREGREPSAYEVGSTIREGVTSIPKALLGFLYPESGPTLSDVGRPVVDVGRGVIGLAPRSEETPAPETPATTPAPAPITEPAGLGALVDRTTEMREPFRMEGTEPSGMRTPQDYLASLARQQARQRAEQPETAEQPVSRYQEELDRLRAQEEDPMRALATFLTGMGSGRGRGLGRSLAAGAQALNAAEREIDARRLQLVEALQNEEITAAEAARENRRLDLMGEEIEVRREYNQQRVDLEQRVERLRAQDRLQEARAALIQGATELFTGPLEQTAIREEVKASNPGLSEAEINQLVQRRTQEKIQDYISSTAESSGLNALATATTQTFEGTSPEDAEIDALVQQYTQ